VRRLAVAALAATLVFAACTGGEEPRTYKAHFERAFQLFPGTKVKVLGVDVGTVEDVRNVESAVEVTFTVDDPEVKIPADVEAAIVPVSLLGERYVQLLPAYRGGPQLPVGATIPLERTATPAEGDELLQAFQDYLGELDTDKVERFVTTAARAVEGRGERLNDLIRSGTEVLETLAAERDDLADMIVQFNTITQTLSTRTDSFAQLLRTYNVVARTVAELRMSLEGTITGLNDAASSLALLLTENRPNLDRDLETLTKTTRTLDRNIKTFARTGKWARRLFRAASRAADYERDWLRLSNQGGPLVQMIMWRLQDRLVGLCLRLDLPGCASQRHWQEEFPELFCMEGMKCPEPAADAGRTVEEALEELPREIESMVEKAARKNCKKAKNPQRCRERKKAAQETEPGALGGIVDNLVKGLGGALGGKS
jgi:phospholipid/cholesterol/gamma-HCH transport system substrate-binding protein